MTSTADNGTPGAHTAVQCLTAIAHHHGVTLPPERLVHEYALGTEEPSLSVVVRMAESNGFKAKAEQIDWPRLMGLHGVFPLMARLDNGNWVIIVGVRRDADQERVAIVDPLAAGAEVLLLDAHQFGARWQGQVVLLKRVFKLTDTEQPFGLLWFVPEILRQGGAFRDIAVAAIMLIGLALATPIFFQLIIDKVLVHESYSTLYVLTAGIVAAIAFESVFGFLRQYLLLGATNKIDIRLARRTFAHLLSLPIDFFESVSAGVVVRHMQQVERIRQFLTGKLFLTLLDALALFFFVPLLFFYSAKLGTIVLLFTLAIAAVVAALIKPFQARLRELYEAEGQRQALLVESIHGMRTVKSLALEPKRRKEWDRRSASAIHNHFRVGKISITAQALTQSLEKLMMVAVIAFGARDVFDHTLTVGALIAFQMISGRVVGPLVQIVSLVHEYQETALSVRMLGEIMNRPAEARGRGAGLAPKLAGRITFDRVTFRYPGATNATLDDISLDLQPGMIVGVVGRSGSGKTTLTRLIQGMYPVSQGLIRVDGIDIREIDLSHLRSSIGVVLQDNFIFRGSVRENINATKPDATFEQIVAAAQAAGADEFIERLPQGYETLLEENGSNLSGGQKQRISIARAILPQPRVLILDEAASALDPESEAIFINNLSRIARGKTVLMVSHRMTTLVGAHAIIAMDQGRIADIGTHQELVARCEIYQQLWRQQTIHV
ncbi:peptidase domain-containing ABC transporter [Sulfurisoma sediminicola]|uniref:ATP-binding cassette subfamily B protein n=1 Tax=Sulfurisoma sediminicola TaxID=1381557 RepID=A0A497XCR6_9PROT|nr:peptidase domain-containing ABC transporter [Sulfurisoma sediminicola]RLJ64730.1 ATP-binding cassette subfamily B protein [Sulfurisoma sediminicola]